MVAINGSGPSGFSPEAHATTPGVNPDPAQFNFETDPQRWAAGGSPIAGIATSTAQHFAGNQSLAVNFNGTAAGSSSVSVGDVVVTAGATITFRVWIPSGSKITTLQPYLQDYNWGWTSSFNGSLTANAWNTITLTVPSTAVSPLQQLGIEFTTSAAWSGTCFIDSVAWPVNTLPTLVPIANQTVNVGQTVAFTASATDTDQPPQTLTFSLLSGIGSATLNANTGAFAWRPAVTNANTTNSFALKVADNGSPILSATQSFTITVNPLPQPTVTSIVLNNGQMGFQVSGHAGPDYAMQVSLNLLNWSTLFITNSPAMPFTWTDTNAATLPSRFYRIKVGPPL
jgi:hypothetical protein